MDHLAPSVQHTLLDVSSCNKDFEEFANISLSVCLSVRQQVETLSWDMVEASWNVKVHAQKSDFVFRRNGRVHLNRPVGVSSVEPGSRGVRISGGNAGYIMFRGSVKSTGYPLHSPVSPSLLLPYSTVCRHISTGVYQKFVPNVSLYLSFFGVGKNT